MVNNKCHNGIIQSERMFLCKLKSCITPMGSTIHVQIIVAKFNTVAFPPRQVTQLAQFTNQNCNTSIPSVSPLLTMLKVSKPRGEGSGLAHAPLTKDELWPADRCISSWGPVPSGGEWSPWLTQKSHPSMGNQTHSLPSWFDERARHHSHGRTEGNHTTYGMCVCALAAFNAHTCM